MSTPSQSPDPREGTREPPEPEDEWLGRVLDERYRVIERIGQGGMGTVYVAEHLALHKQVALKLVHGGHGGDAGGAQRFVREAMVTSMIDHPNVISAIDFGTFENGTAYLAMQLVRGPTLARVLHDEGALTWLRAASIGAQIADALCAAQTHGIVHRDLKPDNVILQELPDGSQLVKLLDFGIAKHARDSLAPPPMRSTQQVTRIGVVVGTLGYMAPEQAVGKRADHRSDLYALGAILWECLVGRRLWSFDDVQQLLAEQLNRAPRTVGEVSGDLTLPEPFDRLVTRLLSINPLERPQSPAEVRDVLRELVAQARQGKLISAPRARPAPVTGELPIATRMQRGVRPDDDEQLTRALGSPHAESPIRLQTDDLSSETTSLPPPAASAFSAGVPTRALGRIVTTERPSEPSQPGESAPQPVHPSSQPAAEHADASLAQPAVNAALQPTAARPSSDTERRWPLAASWPPRRATLAKLAWALAALLVAAWAGAKLLQPSPVPIAKAPPQRAAPPPPKPAALADSVRPLLRSLVEGASRDERVSAAQALLLHVPVDEVPAYGRAMAHLQLAETCLQKKEQLTTIAAVDDPRVLPVLITLAQRKRSGCGPRGKDDCLACLRPELEALVSHFETMQMIGTPR
jgi:eukaryotic-like serine/threonine-protein kinase